MLRLQKFSSKLIFRPMMLLLFFNRNWSNKWNLRPIGPLQPVIQGTQQMVAELDDIPPPCLQGQGVSCQEQTLHIMPSDHLCFLTCSDHDSIPSQATKESKPKMIWAKYDNNGKILKDQFSPCSAFCKRWIKQWLIIWTVHQTQQKAK